MNWNSLIVNREKEKGRDFLGQVTEGVANRQIGSDEVFQAKLVKDVTVVSILPNTSTIRSCEDAKMGSWTKM